jgi:Putative prokaryotic signal transducing protein
VNWVRVASFTREEEARLLAGRLAAEGIQSRVYPEFQGGYYGESVHMPVEVLVPEHRVLEARRVMEELARS